MKIIILKKNTLLLLLILLFFLISCNKNGEQMQLDKDYATVIILAGQSNAEGNSSWLALDSNLQKKYEEGFSDVQISYQMMGYSTRNNNLRFDDVTLGQANQYYTFGPEIGIAEIIENSEIKTKPIYLIKFASGGTNLYTNWASPSTGASLGDEYKRFISFLDDALGVLEDLGVNPKVKAMLWMQGESDATNFLYADSYYERLEYFVEDVFSHLSTYESKDGISFIDATIFNGAYSTGFYAWPYHQLVNDAKILFQKKNKEKRYLIDTNIEGIVIDEFNQNGGDRYHYTSESMLELGYLFANVLLNNEIIK